MIASRLPLVLSLLMPVSLWSCGETANVDAGPKSRTAPQTDTATKPVAPPPDVPPPARTGPPNIVIFSIDTLRADHLGAYGYDRPTSPNMDAFAREAVLLPEAMPPVSPR